MVSLSLVKDKFFHFMKITLLFMPKLFPREISIQNHSSLNDSKRCAGDRNGVGLLTAGSMHLKHLEAIHIIDLMVWAGHSHNVETIMCTALSCQFNFSKFLYAIFFINSFNRLLRYTWCYPA